MLWEGAIASPDLRRKGWAPVSGEDPHWTLSDPTPGTLRIPYLKSGNYDICIGDMDFRKLTEVTGNGTRLKLD